MLIFPKFLIRVQSFFSLDWVIDTLLVHVELNKLSLMYYISRSLFFCRFDSFSATVWKSKVMDFFLRLFMYMLFRFNFFYCTHLLFSFSISLCFENNCFLYTSLSFSNLKKNKIIFSQYFKTHCQILVYIIHSTRMLQNIYNIITAFLRLNNK